MDSGLIDLLCGTGIYKCCGKISDMKEASVSSKRQNIYTSTVKKRNMEQDIRNGLWGNSGYRIRCVKRLSEQIRADHEEINILWKKWKNGLADRADEEEMERVLAWLRQEIGLYKELGKKGIEGILSGEIEIIEKDIRDKERAIMKP